jgi:transcriptional regulator with XRE-family HTH domain
LGVLCKQKIRFLLTLKNPTINRLLPRLKQLRQVHGLTQEAFAEKAGISYKYYQAVEAGRKRELRLSTLERLASAYGLEVYQLLAPQLPDMIQARHGSAKNPSKKSR